jgi:NADPH:quinone reductase-like Zn-dependent oxidoreductase
MKTTTFTCLVALTLCAQAREPQPSPKTSATKMKAVVLHEYGGPEALNYGETPRPKPKDDEILIRVVAASVNPVDVAIRSGKYAEYFHTALPLVPGMDAAGIVETTGSKISKLKAGDPVYAFFTLSEEGGYAEFAVAKESEAARKPASITYEQAAAVPAAGSTAWQALIDAGKLSSGQTVLIHGGSGGVGHMAIQIAKARGARVIATASTANQDFLKNWEPIRRSITRKRNSKTW